ncbi:MAG: response regulator transcription factor [Clostridiales bacterium]|nr:response regulator transcription factor [Clostridiales bacterium]
MIRAAILEDDEKEARVLEQAIARYAKESELAVETDIFDKPLAFLSNYKASYDIIFFDIEMPGMSGLEAAEEIRKSDDTVVIVFVTHMAQLAVKGYGVDATDFVVKPVEYKDFVGVMARVRRRLSVKQQMMHTVRSLSGVVRIDVSEITYVEVYKHRLFYHLANGQTHEAWGTLVQLEEELPADRFCRCNNCYLVNLQFVRGVKDDVVIVGKDELKISRPRKQEFINRLVAFTG